MGYEIQEAAEKGWILGVKDAWIYLAARCRGKKAQRKYIIKHVYSRELASTSCCTPFQRFLMHSIPLILLFYTFLC